MKKVRPREDKGFGLGDPLHGGQSRIIAQALQFLVWWHDVIATKPSLPGVPGRGGGCGVGRGWPVVDPGGYRLRCEFSFCSFRGFTVISGKESQLVSWHLNLRFLVCTRG